MKISRMESCGECAHYREAWCCNPRKRGERSIPDAREMISECPLEDAMEAKVFTEKIRDLKLDLTRGQWLELLGIFEHIQPGITDEIPYWHEDFECP